MDNNRYWEEVVSQRLHGYTDDELVEKIKESQWVIEHLEKDPLWKIINKNVEIWKQNLDAQWQDADEKQIEKIRVLKHACNHLCNLKTAYLQEWKFAQEEMERRKDSGTIQKDYDNEVGE